MAETQQELERARAALDALRASAMAAAQQSESELRQEVNNSGQWVWPCICWVLAAVVHRPGGFLNRSCVDLR